MHVYGMAGTSRTVVDEAFSTVNALGAYVRGAGDQLDRLAYGVGNVSGAVADFQAIVRDDVNVPGLRTKLAVGRRAGRGGCGVGGARGNRAALRPRRGATPAQTQTRRPHGHLAPRRRAHRAPAPSSCR